MPWQEKMATSVQFMKEVRLETRKISWPKREDVVRATLMTLVATVILALFLGLTDLLLQNGIKPLFVGTVSFWTLTMAAYFGLVVYLIYLTTKE